jgi:hypothetical protein
MHHSGGRYFVPSIGRYFSPDAYLDAPFSSQRLDRYNFGFNNPLRYKRSEALPHVTVDLARGTVVAAQGLPAAALTSSFGQLAVELEAARWFVKEAFGAVADAGVERAFGGYQVGRISITASMTRLQDPKWVSRNVQELFGGIETLKGTGKPQTVWSQLWMTRSQADELTKTIARFKSGKPRPGSASEWWPGVGGRMIPLDLAVSFLLTVGIEVGFSWYEDMQVRDIYGLTDQQMVWRTAVRGVGVGLAFWAAVTVVGAVGLSAMPALVIGAMVLAGVQLAWEWGPQQIIFQGYDLYGLYEPRPRTLDLGALQRRRFIH